MASIVAHAFTRIEIQTKHRIDTVTENNKMTNTGMTIK